MHAKTAITLFLLAALLGPTVGCATETEGNLEAVQARTMMLKAQVEQAKARKELADNGGAGGASLDAIGTPAVKEVYARGSALYATFVYRDGTHRPGHVGDTLPGDCRVLSVALEAVRIRCNGQTQTVGFSATAPTSTPTVNTASPYMAPASVPVLSSALPN